MEQTETVKLSVFLSSAEHQALREASAKDGTSMTKKAAQLIRDAVGPKNKRKV